MNASQAPSPRRSRWWWMAWLLFGLLIGAQALRMRAAESAVNARNGPQAVALRPQNGWGQALLAQALLGQGNAPAAIATSRAALERTPLSVMAVRTLARGIQATAGVRAGEPAWLIATMMGWRDRQTQVWALMRALSNAEADVFVMRADALMRTRRDDPQITMIVRQALIEPTIREVFVTRMAVDPVWRERLFGFDQTLTGAPLEGTVQALYALGSTAAPPTRAELRASILSLVAAGRLADAIALDRRLVRRSPDPNSLIDDGGFDRADGDYTKDVTPFDWTIEKSASLDQSQGRRTMVITLDERRRPLVRRYVALPPGRYRLSYSIAGEPPAGKSIGFRLYCEGSGSELGMSPRAELAGGGWERRQVDFSVPGSCQLVRVEITRLPGGLESEARIDNVAIAPVR